MNYLIVDDEVILLRDMERLAREVLPEDSQIYTADNWKSALQLVEQYKPYVVFLDVDMPEMNGLQISGRIEEISPKSNIIFVTGFPEYSLDAWNTNASDFLVKPVLKRDLEKAMGNFVFYVRRTDYVSVVLVILMYPVEDSRCGLRGNRARNFLPIWWTVGALRLPKMKSEPYCGKIRWIRIPRKAISARWPAIFARRWRVPDLLMSSSIQEADIVWTSQRLTVITGST